MPGFELLESGQPDPLVRPVLQVLRSYGMSDWERALWFVVPSPALDGARPVDRLLAVRKQSAARAPELVAAAERRRDWF